MALVIEARLAGRAGDRHPLPDQGLCACQAEPADVAMRGNTHLLAKYGGEAPYAEPGEIGQLDRKSVV